MTPFADLTQRGQTGRLRHLALAALAHYDLDVRRVALLQLDTNCVFRVRTADGRRYVLRVGRPGVHTLAETRAEMAWLAALAREPDIRVAAPVPARGGALFVTAEAPGVPEPRRCALFTWLPGRDLAHHLTPENVEKLGVLTARLHEQALTFTPPPDFTPMVWDHVYFFPGHQPLDCAAYRPYFPPERIALWHRAEAYVQQTLDRLHANPTGRRILHGDLHHWNVKLYRGQLSVFDFEDLLWGYPIQDIAVTLENRWPGDYPALVAAYQRGYTSRAPWPEAYPGQLDALVAGRALMLTDYVIEVAPDPVRRLDRAEALFRALLESA